MKKKMYQNMWVSAKPVMQGKYTALKAYIKGEENTS